MKSFSNEVMEIITAIQSYINKNGNTEAIDRYYQTNGTYEGIIDYLSELEIKMVKDNKIQT